MRNLRCAWRERALAPSLWLGRCNPLSPEPQERVGLKSRAACTPAAALREACTIAKGLFDALNVVPLPTLPHSLLLMGRNASAFQTQPILSILVNEGQGDGGKATFWPRFKPPLHRNMFLRDQFNDFSRHWHQSAETCHLSLLLTL